MDNENQIRNLISKLSDLPTTKSTFLAILNLYQNPYATMKDLEDIVKNDISLTTRILKLVNSSFYGLRNQVTNIEIAVRLLGIGTVKTIALATSVFDFVGFEHIVNKNGLWLHSWMVGFLAKTLAERFSLPDRDILFLAGLLHDIGKLILSKYLSVEYKLVLARLDVEDIDEIRIEKECLNFTHDYLGGLVLKTWGFHEKVCYIVENHHNTDFDNINNTGLKLIVISNILANKYGYSFLKNKKYDYTGINLMEIIQMSKENIDALVADCKKNIPKYIKF